MTKCCAQVPLRQPLIHGPYKKPCGYDAKVVRAGKGYCGTHDPERIARKQLAAKRLWYATRGYQCPD